MLRDQLRELVETSPELKAAVAKLARRVEASDPHVSSTAFRDIPCIRDEIHAST